MTDRSLISYNASYMRRRFSSATANKIWGCIFILQGLHVRSIRQTSVQHTVNNLHELVRERFQHKQKKILPIECLPGMRRFYFSRSF